MIKSKVSVVMITYGHENYIEEAINGVLLQECDFDVELIIANDCSPDATDKKVQNIINTHPKSRWINSIIHEQNLGMIPNFIWALQQCNGKYIALCEGDDYWKDPYKLQKQVDYLEKNKEYGLSYTDFDRCFEEFDEMFINIRRNKPIHEGNIFNKLFFFNPVTNCTVVIRNHIVQDYISSMGDRVMNWQMGDLPLWFFVASNYKVHFLEESTAVYRILESSATNTSIRNKIKFKNSRFQVCWFYIKRKFSFFLGVKFIFNYLKEMSVLWIKYFLNILNLYKPSKRKLIKKIT